MPERLVWTDQRDDQLKRLRVQGIAWDAIAAALGISRNAAIERGRRIGARLPPAEHVPEEEDPERPPLPAGHPITWGAIVADTCLAGAPYPLPVPLEGMPLRDGSSFVSKREEIIVQSMWENHEL